MFQGQFRDGKPEGYGKVCLISSNLHQQLKHVKILYACVFVFETFLRNYQSFIYCWYHISHRTLAGLVTFPDGSHGVPRNEGYFENFKLKKSDKAHTHIQKANHAAEKAKKFVK